MFSEALAALGLALVALVVPPGAILKRALGA
jgi:hypothetical protein